MDGKSPAEGAPIRARAWLRIKSEIRFSCLAFAFEVEMSAARPRTKENVFLFVPNLIGASFLPYRAQKADRAG